MDEVMKVFIKSPGIAKHPWRMSIHLGRKK